MPSRHDRRLFLKYLGAGLTGLSAARSGTLGPIVEARGQMALGEFTAIAPSSADELLLPPEFEYRLIIAWPDRLPGTSSRPEPGRQVQRERQPPHLVELRLDPLHRARERVVAVGIAHRVLDHEPPQMSGR